MNYGWLTPTTADQEYARVVLHEFGHSLGCIHEHESPAGGIKWNKEQVYKDLMGPPNNWPKSQVDSNMFQRYAASITQLTAMDPASIMMYPIPSAWTLDGFSAGLNGELSINDKILIRNVYPR